MSQCICVALLYSHLVLVYPKTKVYGWDKTHQNTDEENIAANAADVLAQEEADAAELEAKNAAAALEAKKAQAPLEQKGKPKSKSEVTDR